MVISHQTVRLEKGRHRSPGSGMCVMELASVLAGERFSDHPRSVCPVIASLLRTYNDLVDSERRQRLIPYAAAVVGTRGDRDLRNRRAAHCAAWAIEHGGRPPRRQWRRRLLAGGHHAPPAAGGTAAARWAMETMHPLDADGHAALLRLVDELIAIAPAPSVPRLPETEPERDAV
jgi:hypothetical protein